MVIVDAVVVLGVVGAVFYLTMRLVTRPQQRPAVATGRWRVAHYDVKGATRVVLQKVSPSGTNVLDEHVVATIPIADPEYDAKFLTATATARERRSVFESEEE